MQLITLSDKMRPPERTALNGYWTDRRTAALLQHCIMLTMMELLLASKLIRLKSELKSIGSLQIVKYKKSSLKIYVITF